MVMNEVFSDGKRMKEAVWEDSGHYWVCLGATEAYTQTPASGFWSREGLILEILSGGLELKQLHRP